MFNLAHVNAIFFLYCFALTFDHFSFGNNLLTHFCNKVAFEGIKKTLDG